MMAIDISVAIIVLEGGALRGLRIRSSSGNRPANKPQEKGRIFTPPAFSRYIAQWAIRTGKKKSSSHLAAKGESIYEREVVAMDSCGMFEEIISRNAEERALDSQPSFWASDGRPNLDSM